MSVRTVRAPVVALVAQLVLLGALLRVVDPGRAGSAVAVACAVLGWVVLARTLARREWQRLGPADHVTLTRGTLACVVAALTAHSALESGPTTVLVVLASVALALDAVDGWVARRTRTTSALGARMDPEVDAFLILVLSVAASEVLGRWVLAIGAFRYAFALATWVLPWLGGAVAPRYWRKAVAALQGIVLTLATAQMLPHSAASAVVLVALVLLAWSFGTQGGELWRGRMARLDRSRKGRTRATQAGPAAVGEPVARPVQVRP
jgi:phosphatidylglycerophosphate synthase